MGRHPRPVARPRKDSIDEATTDRVLKAAEQAFGTLGYRAARLEDIGAQAGIRRSSLLYHFGSKELLYRAVFIKGFEEMSRGIGQSIQGTGDYTTRLEATAARLLTFSEERHLLVSLILREIIEPDGLCRDILDEYFIPLIDALEAFVTNQGTEVLPEGISVRSAVLLPVAAQMVKLTSGELGAQIWKSKDGSETLQLVKTLLVRS